MNKYRRNVHATLAALAAAVITVVCCVPEKVVSPVANYAYVGNETSNNISGYAVDNSTGALTEVTGSPFSGPSGPRDAVVELFGKYVYVANGNASGVYAFGIDSTSGALAAISGSPFAGGSGPRGIALHTSGKYIYTANRNDNNVSGYSIDDGSGVLTAVPGSPFAVPSGSESQPGPQQLTVDPTGRFLYVSDHLTGDISGFTIDGTTGALKLISGSPFSDQDGQESFTQPFALVVAPSGKFLYVTNHGSSTISVFSVDAVSGALAKITGSPFAIPPPSECSARPFGAALGPGGQFLYVADNGCDAISIFSLDAGTGVPTQISGSPVFIGAGEFYCSPAPNDNAVDATGRFLYVANMNCGSVSAFSIDATTGKLTDVAGSPFPAGSGPYGVAISRIN